MMKSEEKFSHGANAERGRIATLKYAESLLHSKVLLSKQKDFTRAFYDLVRRHLFHSNSYDLVAPPKGEKKKLANTCEVHTDGGLLIR